MVKQAVLSGLLDQLRDRPKGSARDGAADWREIQLLRALGELEQAREACAAYARRWPESIHAVNLLTCLNHERRPASRDAKAGAAPFVRIRDFLTPPDHAAVNAHFAAVAADRTALDPARTMKRRGLPCLY